MFLSISVISGGDTSYFSKKKPATGNIGVGFVLYEMDEYNKVTVEHKDELRRYHNNQSAKNGDQGNKTNEGNKK